MSVHQALAVADPIRKFAHRGIEDRRGGVRLGRNGKGLAAVAIVWSAGSVASCSEGPGKDESDLAGLRGSIVLAVSTPQKAFPGPIQGKVRCEGDLGFLVEPCLAEDLTLARAVLSCGPTEATIDRGQTHHLVVRFPARLSERFPGMPADLDIVRCVQSRVGFSFFAGAATGDEANLYEDQAPFQSLHSKRPGEK